jgi:hypothetical protein
MRMIMRILWFGGVFCLFAWIGAYWDGFPTAIQPPFDPTAAISVIERPFHELVRALTR